jgi:hypothetical protein
MRKLNQNGAVSGLMLSLFLSMVFLVATISFAAWAYSSRQDYKNNSDEKVQAAVVTAKQQESKTKDAAFAEAEKYPLRTYLGPEAYGSVTIKFPKSWSAYVDDNSTSSSSTALDGYFYPNVVPGADSKSTPFALRVQVVGQSYSDIAKSLANEQKNPDSKDTPLTIAPYALPNVPKVVGLKVSGTVHEKDSKLVTMVVFPLRSQTLEVWTEGTQFTGDFEKNILPNLSFSP